MSLVPREEGVRRLPVYPLKPVAQKYQELFADEARAALGQPGIEEIEELLGLEVVIRFNHNDDILHGKLTAIGDDKLILDHKEHCPVAMRSIQSIERI